jgi:hypothetical protein
MFNFEFLGYTQWMSVADMDKDGLSDILLSDTASLRWFRNLGPAGSFNFDTGAILHQPPPATFLAYDFDQDGDFDIAAADAWQVWRENLKFQRLPNGTIITNANFSFKPAEEVVSEVASRWYMALGDFNADRVMDIAAVGDSDCAWWPNMLNTRAEGEELWGPEHAAVNYSEAQFAYVHWLAAGDVNKDGADDLLVCGSNVWLLRNQGAAFNFSFPAQPGLMSNIPTEDYWHCAIQDIDNDSWPDLILSSYFSAGKVSYVLNDKTGNFPNAPIIIAQDNNLWPGVMSIADFDKDGDIDVVFPRVNTPWGLEVWKNQLCP